MLDAGIDFLQLYFKKIYKNGNTYSSRISNMFLMLAVVSSLSPHVGMVLYNKTQWSRPFNFILFYYQNLKRIQEKEVFKTQ